MKILISGATGFIGQNLLKHLAQKHEIYILTRKPSTLLSIDRQLFWSGKDLNIWAQQLNHIDAVINLSGEPLINKRWTQKQKNKIRISRIQSTRTIVNAINQSKTPPKIFINASAIGYYGHSLSSQFDENSNSGHDFLSQTCQKWEYEAHQVISKNTRVIIARLGIVLDPNGGMLKKLIPQFQYYLGGTIGKGQQWLSWIAMDDLMQAFETILDNSNISGPINLVSEKPITMNEFCQLLARSLKKPYWIHLPETLFKIILGDVVDMLTSGQYVLPTVLMQHHFNYKYKTLEQFFNNTLQSNL